MAVTILPSTRSKGLLEITPRATLQWQFDSHSTMNTNLLFAHAHSLTTQSSNEAHDPARHQKFQKVLDIWLKTSYNVLSKQASTAHQDPERG